jgi:hypothetical protein
MAAKIPILAITLLQKYIKPQTKHVLAAFIMLQIITVITGSKDL